ncbi:Uncharacterised protein [Chryseobacterium taihuense]|uniref:Uncharacterized protein n=2 Tax=Chryseobacterium group TaxID=2782232 RepID=A0A4U8WBA6_9FLAO|nr:Uncharacterised protein [Chryseobacterium taihuense]
MLFFFLISCSKEENTFKFNFSNYIINISLKKNHQFLREYQRYLTITSTDGTKLSSIELKEDIGTGANSYLFEKANDYILIDCDGNWYSINKKNGAINLLGNFFGKKLPDNYLGTFVIDGNKIIFKKQQNLNLKDIYVFGGE